MCDMSSEDIKQATSQLLFSASIDCQNGINMIDKLTVL